MLRYFANMLTNTFSFSGYFALLICLCFATGDAKAQTLIRDAEIESTIKDYATPLFQVAGLPPGSIEVYIIKDDELNAFVSGGGKIFIHTGLLHFSDDPTSLVGVLAHEIGHISGSHSAGMKEELYDAYATSLIASLLGIGAAILTQDARVGAAVGAAGQDIAIKPLLSYSRNQEAAADQAAVTYLEKIGLNSGGLIAVMEDFVDQEVLISGNAQNVYLRTHPPSRDRLNFLRNALAHSPHAGRQAPEEWQIAQKRLRAKLIGFLGNQREMTQAYPNQDKSLPAMYARAIFEFKNGSLRDALRGMDGLLQDHPDDPYFLELKGQMLYENGRIGDSLPYYTKAADLLPFSPLLRLGLADVQLQTNTPDYNIQALENLSVVLAEEPDNPSAWRLSAIAYGRQGKQGMTALSLAEMNAARRQWREALGQSRRAVRLLEKGSPAWLRASDLANLAEYEFEKSD